MSYCFSYHFSSSPCSNCRKYVASVIALEIYWPYYGSTIFSDRYNHYRAYRIPRRLRLLSFPRTDKEYSHKSCTYFFTSPRNNLKGHSYLNPKVDCVKNKPCFEGGVIGCIWGCMTLVWKLRGKWCLMVLR